MEESYINFIYNENPIKILAYKNECMKDIFKKFYAKISTNKTNYIFLYNGLNINENLKLEELTRTEKKITILVYDNDSTNLNDKKLTKSIICPECGEDCLINMENYKINLSKCDNGHNKQNILLNEIKDIQKSFEEKINCNDCKKNISQTFNKTFYKCCECKINLCPLCKTNHKKEHIILDFDIKNYRCNIHGERYILYCKNCEKNLCDICELNHDKDHNIITHKEILIDQDYKQNLKKLKAKINDLKSLFEEYNKKMKLIINNIEEYYNLCFDFINNYDKRNRNYQTLKNLDKIYDINLQFQNDINNIIEDKNFLNQVNSLKNIYDKMIKKDLIKNFKMKQCNENINFNNNIVNQNQNNFNNNQSNFKINQKKF